jgi:hypothetical protein
MELILRSNPLLKVQWQQVIFITPHQETKPCIGIAKAASEITYHYCSTVMAGSKSQSSVQEWRHMYCGYGILS